MATKTCTKCNIQKPIEEFKQKNRKLKSGTVRVTLSSCKKCYKKHYTGKYPKTINTPRQPKTAKYTHAERIKRRSDRRVLRHRQFIYEYLSVRSCVDCGCSNWIVLEFDHLPEYEKTCNISEMHQMSLDRIKAEIAKCEVVCSNCHTIRSFKQSGAWRLTFEETLNPLNLCV